MIPSTTCRKMLSVVSAREYSGCRRILPKRPDASLDEPNPEYPTVVRELMPWAHGV